MPPPLFDERPPGERYYRHPGDVVRLVLWGLVTIVLVLLIELAEGTNAGLRQDLGEAAGLIPRAVRQLALAVAQVGAVARPGGRRRVPRPAAALATDHRARRVGGRRCRACSCCSTAPSGSAGPVPEALGDDSWLISTRFPSPTYLAAAAAATVVGKPWLAGAWRRAADRAPGRSSS